VTNVVDEGSQSERNDNTQGKHSRCASLSTTTQNTEAQQSVVVQAAAKATLDHPGSPPIALSHEEDSKTSLATTTSAPSTEVAAPKSDHSQIQEPAKKPKTVPTKIAVPNIELFIRKLPPTSASTPPTAFFSVTSPTSEKASVAGTPKEAPHSHQEVEGMLFPP